MDLKKITAIVIFSLVLTVSQGQQTFGPSSFALLSIGSYTVNVLNANWPAASWNGYLAQVKDSTSATACGPGGGGFIVLCYSNGTSWIPFNGGIGTASFASPPPIGNVTPNTGAFTTFTANSINNVIMADTQPGATPCDKINSAISSAPFTGAVIDARGFNGSITGSCPTITINKAVSIKFGAGQLTLTGCPGINITTQNSVIIEGQGWYYAYSPSENTGSILRSGSACPLIADTGAGSQGAQLRNIDLFGNSLGTVGWLGPMTGGVTFKDSHIHGFQHMGIFITGGSNFFSNLLINNNGGDGMVMSSDSVVEGNMQIAFNSGTGLHIVSAGDRITDSDSDHNGLHNIWADGNTPDTWAANSQIIAPHLFRPSVGNAGNYYFFPGNVGGTTGSSLPNWCQTSGCSFTDGTVTWYNVNIVGGSLPFSGGGGVASNMFLDNLYVDDAGTQTVSTFPSFKASNILMDGAGSSQRCYDNELSNIYTSQGQVTGTNTDAIHLNGCTLTNMTNFFVYGEGFNPAVLTPDRGGLILEYTNWSNFTNMTSEFNQRSSLQLLNSTQYNQFVNIHLFFESSNTTPVPYNYGLYIDSTSNANQFTDLFIESKYANAKGIYSATTGLNVVDNYFPTGTAAGTLAFDSLNNTVLTNAHGRDNLYPVEFDIGDTHRALLVDNTGAVRTSTYFCSNITVGSVAGCWQYTTGNYSQWLSGTAGYSWLDPTGANLWGTVDVSTSGDLYWRKHINTFLGYQVTGTTVIDQTMNASFAKVTIGGTNTAPVVATPTVGQAACIYSAGPPIQIGKCTSVVGSGGACTCAP